MKALIKFSLIRFFSKFLRSNRLLLFFILLNVIFDCCENGNAGVFLPDLCEIQRSNPHRAMAELLSSGVALGPASSDSSFSMVAAPPISI